jgi:hypothetical protein
VLIVVAGVLVALERHSLPQLTVNVHLHTPGKAQEERVAGGVDETRLPVPPLDVMEFIAQESEPWAREQLLSEAHRLYAASGSWEEAFMLLKGPEKD